MQGQPPPEGGEHDKEREQTDDKKQKENTAYAKKMVLRLAGLMGVGGAVSMVYVFGELLLASAPHLLKLWKIKTRRIRIVRVSFRPSPVVVMDCPGDDEKVPSARPPLCLRNELRKLLAREAPLTQMFPRSNNVT